MTKPKVTFLIPAYNALPYIKYTIDSIVSQSNSNFLVLVVNDGSTDGTGEYLDTVKDPRFKIIHQKNSGYVRALNTGASMIDTEYIARLDADDIALPDRLKKQISLLDQNPDVAVVGSRIGYVFGKNRRLGISLGSVDLTPEFGPPMSKCPFWDPIEDGQTISHSSATIRRSAFEAVGGYRLIAPAEDIDLWIRLKDAGFRLACIPEVLCLYRVVPGSESGQGYARQLHITKYAYECHLLRSAKLEIPTFEDYAISNPLNESELAAAKIALRTRSALGNLLAGNMLKGMCQIASLAIKDRRHLLNKIKSRCRQA